MKKSPNKQIAEQIIRSAIDDIRWPDILLHARDHEQADEINNLIETARVTIRWSR